MKKFKLFYEIAAMAIAAGREISLADDDTRSTNRVLNGAFQDAVTDYRRLTLTVFAPSTGEGREEAEDEESDS